MIHWASSLMGKPWSPDGEGPDTFCCWGLVRWVFAHRHGIAMPALTIGGDDNVAAIKRASVASGWRQAGSSQEPIEGDIVLMRAPDSGRHVGVMVGADRRLGLLHSNGFMRDGKPTGGVVFQPLRAVAADGYRDFEFWRLAMRGAPIKTVPA